MQTQKHPTSNENLQEEIAETLANESVTEEAKTLLRAAAASGNMRRVKLLLKPTAAIPPLGEEGTDA